MGIFGDVSRTLFGGEKTEAGNKAYKQINQQFSPWIERGGASMGAAANIMGLGGPEARSEALNDWWGSSGGDFLLNKGLDDVDAFMRAKGLSTSGAAMKGMEDYRAGLASTKMNEAMQNLMGLSRLGLGAGGVVSDAGRYTEGEASKGGLGQAIGAFLAFSDPRLKTDVEKIGEEPDGLGVFRFRYKWASRPTVGVMADEVERLRPWALGPLIGGFRTVRYDLLEAS